ALSVLREHVGGGDGAADRAALRRASLSAGGTVAQVRAQEHHDAAVDRPLGEVEVRLGHVPFDVEIAELVVDRRIVVADGGREETTARRGGGGHLLEAPQTGDGRSSRGLRRDGGRKQHDGYEKHCQARLSHLFSSCAAAGAALTGETRVEASARI